MVRSSEVLVKLRMKHCQLEVLATALHHNEMPIGVDHENGGTAVLKVIACIKMKCQ